MAARILWDHISASHVFLCPLTSAESLLICADTIHGGTRPMASGSTRGLSNAVLQMQSILGEHTSPHAPTIPTWARSAPTSPMAGVHPHAAGVEPHFLTMGSAATALHPPSWRLSHCRGTKCPSSGLCGVGHLIACRCICFPQSSGKKREGPGHHFLSQQVLLSLPVSYKCSLCLHFFLHLFNANAVPACPVFYSCLIRTRPLAWPHSRLEAGGWCVLS